MKKVLVFGTFDLLHPGHINFLEQARAVADKGNCNGQAKNQGDFLIVVVARDENVKKLKGMYPTEDEKTRKKKLEAQDTVDEVIMGYKNYKKRMDIIKEINPNIICLGYDQDVKLPGGKYDVIKLKPYQPEKYKSSLLKSRQI